MQPRGRCDLLAKADGGHKKGSFRLASLTRRSARCAHRSATGQVGNLNALRSLQQLDLKPTQVTGDIGSLSALTNLQKLDLKSTQVTGDIGNLRALENLQQLGLPGNWVQE